MRLLIINPNTTEDFTEKITFAAKNFDTDEISIDVINPAKGPKSIECIYDEIISAASAMECIIPKISQYDGFVVACYSDHPLVYALREITDKPVLGIAEASMYMACMLGEKFSIVTTNKEWEPLLWKAVNSYGLQSRCASVRTTNLPVLALESMSRDEIYDKIKKAAEEAAAKDKAEVICLGCAGMAGFDKNLSADLKLPVIDGVASAVLFISNLVKYKQKTSKAGIYSQPKYKAVIGWPAEYETIYSKE